MLTTQNLNVLESTNMVNVKNINPPASQSKINLGGDRKLRCAIYARVSTEMEGQKTSIENQIDIFKKYAEERGWEITHIYTDKKSGTKRNRPGFKQLIDDGKEKKFDLILAKELSRLARNGALSYELRDTCQLHNIHIVCLDNSINTIEGNIQNFGLFAWLYENESNNSSRRNKQARKAKAMRGQFIGSNPPYGYRCKNGKLFIREDETPDVVRRIFNDYLAGKGMDTIAKDLFNEFVPTPSQVIKKKNASKIWHPSTVKNILKNQHYCGDMIQLRTETISVTTNQRRDVAEDMFEVHTGTHEAIISKETFNAVQTMLKKRTSAATAPSTHLFSNLIFCEECGKGMWYKANQKGYRCGGNIRHGERYCLNRQPIRSADVEQVILSDLRNLFEFFKDDSLLSDFENKVNSKKYHIQESIKKLDDKIESLELKRRNYIDLFTEQIISREELDVARASVNSEIEILKLNKSELENNLESCCSQSHTLALKKKLEQFLSVEKLNSQMLNSLVNKITFSIDGEIKIHYNFENPFQKQEKTTAE